MTSKDGMRGTQHHLILEVNNMPKNTTLTWRVKQLEKTVCSMDIKMDSLLQNHMPHIEQRMTRLETKMTVLTGVNIGAIIFALLINKFL